MEQKQMLGPLTGIINVNCDGYKKLSIVYSQKKKKKSDHVHHLMSFRASHEPDRTLQLSIAYPPAFAQVIAETTKRRSNAAKFFFVSPCPVLENSQKIVRNHRSLRSLVVIIIYRESPTPHFTFIFCLLDCPPLARPNSSLLHDV